MEILYLRFHETYSSWIFFDFLCFLFLWRFCGCLSSVDLDQFFQRSSNANSIFLHGEKYYSSFSCILYSSIMKSISSYGKRKHKKTCLTTRKLVNPGWKFLGCLTVIVLCAVCVSPKNSWRHTLLPVLVKSLLLSKNFIRMDRLLALLLGILLVTSLTSGIKKSGLIYCVLLDISDRLFVV